MKPKTHLQLLLPFDIFRDLSACRHESCFETMAYVPAGMCCMICGKLLFQYLPQSPEVLGYLSADWAWHHRDGKQWTTR